jgi:hypothetical protein
MLQGHISLYHVMIDGNLQQLAGADVCSRLPSPSSGRGFRIATLLRTIWREASYRCHVTFSDSVIVEVLKTLTAENVTAVEHSMTSGALFGIWKSS